MLNGFRCYTYNSKSGGEANLDIRRVQQGIVERPSRGKQRCFRCKSDAKRIYNIVSCRSSTATADEYLSPRITFAPVQGIRGRRVTAGGLPQVDSSGGVRHGDGGIKARSKAGARQDTHLLFISSCAARRCICIHLCSRSSTRHRHDLHHQAHFPDRHSSVRAGLALSGQRCLRNDGRAESSRPSSTSHRDFLQPPVHVHDGCVPRSRRIPDRSQSRSRGNRRAGRTRGSVRGRS